ncbi:hypothetical protein HELRODRAFT_185055 [Helobdella robusta]|uniref:Alpha-ketoglutarate-dependent dioxygenase alkB homolog 3 n=1 Tax=Helobdella robusta TaxID=6412 RepID=T1FMC0_HELRO|nr:hypothetical protein HELRODRAFT_185055 [Helobdella robusta]ESN99185.1 hypothetical protein HELRODRAFT_185055 [Helobdella robusta]
MSDQRRNVVQGAWANVSTRSKKVDGSLASKKGMVTFDVRKTAEKNDNASSGSNLVKKSSFQFENVELPREPSFRTINQSGDYIISDEPNGQSRIALVTNFIDSSECGWMFDQLNDELSWKQHEVHRIGKTYMQPRMTAWIGNVPYSYSGITHKCQCWNPLLTMLKDTIENKTGHQYNSVLANLYRDGHDHVPWHCDDEKDFDTHPSIASLSFGDSRIFELRRKPYKNEHLKSLKNDALTDADYLEYIKIPLNAGSLLLMEGAVQLDWQHRIVREYHDRGPRINLTFRSIIDR